MSTQDAQNLKDWFKAIDYFHHNPQRGYIAINGRLIAKKPTLRLFRYFLRNNPFYSREVDDNKLVEKLFTGYTNKDKFIQSLFSQAEPLLPPEMAPQLEQVSSLPSQPNPVNSSEFPLNVRPAENSVVQSPSAKEETAPPLPPPAPSIPSISPTPPIPAILPAPSTSPNLSSLSSPSSPFTTLTKNLTTGLKIKTAGLLKHHAVQLALGSLLSGGAGALIGIPAGSTGVLLGAASGGSLPLLVRSGIISKLGNGILSPLLSQSQQNPSLPISIGSPLRSGALNLIKKSVFGKYLLIGAIAVTAVLLLIMIPMGLLETTSLLPPSEIAEGAILPPGIPGGGQPGTGPIDQLCNFSSFNILQNNTVSDETLAKYVTRALTSGKIKTDEQKNSLPSRAKYIRDQAQGAGLNPAIFLGYWESESAFSDYTYPGVRPGMDLGCDPLNKSITTFEENVLCAVGKSPISNSRTSQCALSHDRNSQACQAILFQEQRGELKLPINSLQDFLNSYGSKIDDPKNINSDNIVKQTIADLGLVKCNPTPPPIPTDTADKIKWIKDNFGIEFADPIDSTPKFSNEVYTWVADILKKAAEKAPRFNNLLHSQHTESWIVIPICGISNASADNVQITNCNGKGAQSGEIFFKQLFIHELAHKINGKRPGAYGPSLASAITAEGYLTAYSANASPLSSEICANSQTIYDPADLTNTRQDEDFSESVSYYIDDQTPEQNYGCGTKSPNSPPFQGGTKYQKHFNFIQQLLTGTTQPSPKIGGYVVLDPGHGNPDPEIPFKKSDEGNLNLTIANQVKSLLVNQGVTVSLTHTGFIAYNDNNAATNRYTGLQKRIDIINNFSGQLFISIHFDSGNYGTLQGPVSYYNEGRSFSGENVKLANNISSALSEQVSNQNGSHIANDMTTGVFTDGQPCKDPGPYFILGKEGDLTCPDHQESKIIRPSNYPGIISEYFTAGKSYNELLNDQDLIKKISLGYCNGIVRYLTSDNNKSCQ